MFCKYCGKKIDKDSIFCAFCGKKIKKEDIDVLNQKTNQGHSMQKMNLSPARSFPRHYGMDW